MPHTAYIVDCARTASGKKNGSLKGWHPADLGAAVIDALLARTKIDGAHVDDVIWGCVSQVGAQAGNIGRNIVLSSNLPESVPGTSVDRQCGSSQQAVHFAAQAVMSGVQDVVIAGGVELMSTVPIGSNVADGYKKGRGLPMNKETMRARYGPQLEAEGMKNFSQFDGAEIMARDFGLSREDLDRFAVESHRRAHHATTTGRFAREIVPVACVDADGAETVHRADQGIRPGTTYETLSKLKPLKGEGSGVITAGTSSQIADGAAAVLICNEAGLAKLGLSPRAKIVSLALAGTDPVVMLAGPIAATQNAFKRCGLSMADMDLYEVNEAFAPVPLAWAKALGADLGKLNVNGGAMALGHPLGCTGAKLMTTLVNELERTGGRYGLQAICEGGGTANATIIERCAPPSKL